MQIFIVEALTGQAITLAVEALDTISDVKNKIQASEIGMQPGQQLLIFGVEVISDSSTISEYGIVGGDSLTLIAQGIFDVHFCIDGFDGGDPATATVSVTASNTFDSVKVKLAEQFIDQDDEDAERLDFLFSYGGEIPEDGRTLSDYNIQKNSVIFAWCIDSNYTTEQNISDMRKFLDSMVGGQQVCVVNAIVKYDTCLDLGFTYLQEQNYNMSIEDLKEVYYKETTRGAPECHRLAPQFQQLWIDGNQVEDGKLSDYNIQKHPFLFVEVANTGMTISAKTLCFGELLVDCDALMTIKDFRKALCKTIDSACTGVDVEPLIAYERSAALTMGSKLLDDRRTLISYDIRNMSTVESRFHLGGSGKRARSDGDGTSDAASSAGGSIPASNFFEVMKQPTDSVAATEIIDASGFDMQGFLSDLSLEDLEQLESTVRDKKRIGTSDTAVRAFGAFLPLIAQIQEEQNRLNKVKLLGLAKFKESYLSFTNREVSVFHEKVKTALKEKREKGQKEAIDRATAEAKREAQAALASASAGSASMLSRLLG